MWQVFSQGCPKTKPYCYPQSCRVNPNYSAWSDSLDRDALKTRESFASLFIIIQHAIDCVTWALQASESNRLTENPSSHILDQLD
jgi:hypothetical protein